MASNTENVKLGVCQIFFDGIDLGYTKGGVEVEVTSETKKVEVDQFGKTPIDEIIMSRAVSVKAPLAETTLENLVRTMPGARLESVGGAKANGTITIASQPAADDTVVINGSTFTFKAGAANGAAQVLIGGNAAATAQNLLAKILASQDVKTKPAEYTIAGAVITVRYDEEGFEGNGFTLAKTGAGVTVSGATLTGGADGTNKRVVVPTGIGRSLLRTAKELRLHPKDRDASDKSDDFVIPKANTAGGLTFAYNFENERVFSTTFMGYPDAETETLFYVGNDAA